MADRLSAIERFASPGCGSSFGSSFGYSDGSGYGYGYGSGHGDVCGCGSGYSDGSGYGDGFGYGDGYGYGSGYSDGFGYGDGSGSGHGDGSNLGSINGERVEYIDGVPTILHRVRGNVARGAILHKDLTLRPCYVVKQDGLFAHGGTLRKAMDALRDKLFENMPEEDRIKAFLTEHKPGVKYPNRDLYDWHHRLTGSCDMGRREFAAGHGIDVERGEMTVEEFISLTRNAYGGDVIRRLEKAM